MDRTTYYWAAGATRAQPDYHQFKIEDGCAVGCGATAWTMLFGWVDYQAAHGNRRWKNYWGLYRKNGAKGGADAVAPLIQTRGVENVMAEIRQHIGTFCAFGQGATPPWTMVGARRYFSGRAYPHLTTHYSPFGIHANYFRDRAISSIRDRKTPVVIGTGWLSHYPLAFGYAVRRRIVTKCFIGCWKEAEYIRTFCVNQGWRGSGFDWVPASTWFSGEVLPIS